MTLGPALCWATYMAFGARVSATTRRSCSRPGHPWAGRSCSRRSASGSCWRAGAIGPEQAADAVRILLAVLYSARLDARTPMS